MTPNSLHLLARNFTSLEASEHKDLQELSNQYPYSQVLHMMLARSAKDHGSTDQQDRLHRAAIYSTDRMVVKRVMTAPRAERIVEPVAEVIPTPVVEVPVAAPAKAEVRVVQEKKTDMVAPVAEAKTVNPLEGDALREDIVVQLNRLQQLKHDFEESYEHLKHPEIPLKETKSKKAETPKEPELIEEIKATRKKLKVPSPKVVEQGEIIDNFIKVAPTLPKAKSVAPTTDLSEESVNYSDNIISETLVNILVKQGKKAKAIEMLKKLIWKFPQKKAYFAAQIDELKN
jgi:hypothetical protein